MTFSWDRKEIWDGCMHSGSENALPQWPHVTTPGLALQERGIP